VDETADLAEAARQIARGAFLYAGQICISTQRIYVVEAVADEFRDLLLSETSRIRSGDPSDEYTINGPLIDSQAIQRIQEWLQEAYRSGAEVLAGGNLIDAECRIFSPTILTRTTPDMKLVKEEVFGPIAIFETIRNMEQGVDLANASEYGLQCGVFSNHLERIKYAYQKLEYGAVIINSAPGFRVDQMPYGGIKSSGIGREGIRYAMDAYTEKKLLVF
jgi:glyceraldehyde-3-phosphate dehydrogenase (NADP+)